MVNCLCLVTEKVGILSLKIPHERVLSTHLVLFETGVMEDKMYI